MCDGDKHPERIDAIALMSAHAGVRVDYDDVKIFTPSTDFWLERGEDAVLDLYGDGVLNGGQANALLRKLEHARAKIDQGKPQVAIHLLEAFLHQVDDFEANAILTEAQAETLRTTAQRALDSLT